MEDFTLINLSEQKNRENFCLFFILIKKIYYFKQSKQKQNNNNKLIIIPWNLTLSFNHLHPPLPQSVLPLTLTLLYYSNRMVILIQRMDVFNHINLHLLTL